MKRVRNILVIIASCLSLTGCATTYTLDNLTVIKKNPQEKQEACRGNFNSSIVFRASNGETIKLYTMDNSTFLNIREGDKYRVSYMRNPSVTFHCDYEISDYQIEGLEAK